ncbi:MAG: hypothetical protein LBC92_00610, partial [Rickettsiales bacterium]|nr:hypothetical protein [Rickettsiales bacterium]
KIKNKKILVLINPPYVESTEAGSKIGGGKSGASQTKLNDEYFKKKWGRASNELFTQFLAKIYDTLDLSLTTIAVFSKMKYCNSKNFEKFREVFKAKFLGGFLMPSKAFYLKGDFPIGFCIWDATVKEKITQIDLDVLEFKFDKKKENIIKIEKTEIKSFYSYENKTYLNDWLPKSKPDGTKAIPLSNPLDYFKGKGIRQEQKNKGQIGYISGFAGSDFQHNNIVYILSEVAGHGNGNGIILKNLKHALIYLAVRKCIAPTWLNDRDQFLKPNFDVDEPQTLEQKDFISNCIVYALFNGANNTSECVLNYKDKDWKITNYFFPFKPEELGFRPADFPINKKMMEIGGGLEGTTNYEFYMPDWLEQFSFTCEAEAVLSHCKKIYILYENLLNAGEFKREIVKELQLCLNAGWYQIKKSFTMSAGLKSYNAKKIDDWLSGLNVSEECYTLWGDFDRLYENLRREVEIGVWRYEFLK